MNLQPKIISNPERKIIGMSQMMSWKNFQISELAKRFMPCKKNIVNTVSSDIFSINIFPERYFNSFTPSTEFVKWLGVEVEKWDFIPDEMETMLIPSGLYAVFHYKGMSSDNSIFQYIHNTWLPASEYRMDNRPHFEILGNKYQNNHPDSEEEIWIPIVPK